MLAAEAAVKNGEFASAREACHEFFLDGGGARDQFYCRALFVKVPQYSLPLISFFPSAIQSATVHAQQPCPLSRITQYSAGLLWRLEHLEPTTACGRRTFSF